MPVVPIVQDEIDTELFLSAATTEKILKSQNVWIGSDPIAHLEV